MMKKLAMFAFVMALVVAFVLPAFAYTVEGGKDERFTMGGVMSYDLGYRTTDAAHNTFVEPYNGGVNNTRFFSAVDYWSTIYGLYTVGNASFFWRLYAMSDEGVYNKNNNDSMVYGPTDYTNFRDTILLDTFYGSYKFGTFTISAGKQEGSTVSWGMSQRLGYSPSGGYHVAGIAYGFVYDQKYPQLRLVQEVSKQFSYQISLVSTGTYAEPAGPTNTTPGTSTIIINGTTTTLPNVATTGIRQSYADFPMIAVKAMMNFGPVALNPAAAYQQVQWDNLQPGWDTTMTAWLGRLPVQVKVGGFTGTAEVTYGQNIGGGSQMANIASGEATYSLYQRVNGQIKNGNTFAYWADLAYTIGPVTPHIYAGQTNSINKDFYTSGDNSNTRSIYGINAYYVVTPNFYIIPEVFGSDLGKIPGPAAAGGGLKLGTDWLAGVNFSFFF